MDSPISLTKHDTPAGHANEFVKFLAGNPQFLPTLVRWQTKYQLAMEYPALVAQGEMLVALSKNDEAQFNKAKAQMETALNNIKDSCYDPAMAAFTEGRPMYAETDYIAPGVLEQAETDINANELWVQETGNYQYSVIGQRPPQQTIQQTTQQTLQPTLQQQQPPPQQGGVLGTLKSAVGIGGAQAQPGMLAPPVIAKVTQGNHAGMEYYDGVQGGPPQAAYAVGTYMAFTDLTAAYPGAIGWSANGTPINAFGEPIDSQSKNLFKWVVNTAVRGRP